MKCEIFLCRDYIELLSRSSTLFGDQLFLENKTEKISFIEFYRNIRSIASGEKFKSNRSIILNINNQIRFAQAYFAGVITGHLVFLENKGPGIENVVTVNEEEIQNYLTLPPMNESDIPLQNPNIPCTVAFSSGTTSKNKGVLLSQRNLLYDSAFSTENFRFSVGERLIHILPFHHLFGLVADLITSLLSGSCMYIVDSPLLFFRALKYFKPHCVNMPPALAEAVCNEIENSGNISSVTGGCLTRVLCAGAPMKERTFDSLRAYGILPGMAYGLTECSPCISITKGTDVRYGTSGVPIGCVDVKIAENGEILVSGDTLMKGYLDGSEDVNPTDGYFHTGDIGRIDENGHLIVLGRRNTMLVFSNGKKCIPEMIEEKLNSVGGIEECMLRVTENGITPEVVAVTQTKEIPYEQIKSVMKEEGLYPFILKIQNEKLPRNLLGKVIRDGI